jgi:uridylate kinase
MALYVQKFGGTSVGSAERIRNVARRVAKWRRAGHEVVVVPSAMSGETNRLLALAAELQAHPDARELDVVAATGEQVTAGLVAMALMEHGVAARSYAGWQVSVLTDSAHTRARILSIDGARIRKDLAEGRVVVVDGFQGVDGAGNVTTLGRGGSDTSAVALAAALGADECQIYTDVDGVYTTDPRIVPEARRLHTVTFEEMLEMASAGSKVLQIRSVEFAAAHQVIQARVRRAELLHPLPRRLAADLSVLVDRRALIEIRKLGDDLAAEGVAQEIFDDDMWKRLAVGESGGELGFIFQDVRADFDRVFVAFRHGASALPDPGLMSGRLVGNVIAHIHRLGRVSRKGILAFQPGACQRNHLYGRWPQVRVHRGECFPDPAKLRVALKSISGPDHLRG